MLHARERKTETLFRKIQTTSTAVVNASPLDREYLHYPLDMDDVILNASLLPALR